MGIAMDFTEPTEKGRNRGILKARGLSTRVITATICFCIRILKKAPNCRNEAHKRKSWSDKNKKFEEQRDAA